MKLVIEQEVVWCKIDECRVNDVLFDKNKHACFLIVLIFQVGNPKACTEVANQLLNKHGFYVQAINSPTVSPGEERLRIAPTPFHTPEMMDQFVEAMVASWKSCGLPFTVNECAFCKKTLNFEEASSLQHNHHSCGGMAEVKALAQMNSKGINLTV